MRRCPIISGILAPCLSDNARNSVASSRRTPTLCRIASRSISTRVGRYELSALAPSEMADEVAASDHADNAPHLALTRHERPAFQSLIVEILQQDTALNRFARLT